MGPQSIPDWLTSRRAAAACLAVAVAVSAVLLLSLDSSLTFLADDWALLVRAQEGSTGALLDPYHEHIVLGPVLTFKLLLTAFGMSSALPFYVVSISSFLLSAVLVFVYMRRRVGDWPALVGAILILFLGAAFEDLLLSSQVGYFGSMAAGLGMLVALDRGNRRGDRLACGLLAVSLAFSSLGFVFALGALTEVALGRRPRGQRLYIGVLPLSLFALWWMGWGHEAQSHVSFDNLVHLPGYVFDAAAAGIVSLLGLATGDGSEPDQPHLIWGQILLPVAAMLVALRVWRDRRISPGLAITLVMAFAFWALAGLNQTAERFPTSSRYQYPSAVFILLIAAEALRGLRIPRFAVIIAAVGTVAAAIGGVSLMEREHSERWEPAAESIRSSLAAVDLAGPAAQPSFEVVIPPNISVPAETYLDMVEAHGSPAFGEVELATRPEPERSGADLTMAQALGLALLTPDPAERTLACQPLQATAAGDTGVTLLHGGFTLANRGSAPFEVELKRFSEGSSVFLGSVEAGVTTALTIPVDNAAQPWTLGLTGAGPVRLCTTEAA